MSNEAVKNEHDVFYLYAVTEITKEEYKQMIADYSDSILHNSLDDFLMYVGTVTSHKSNKTLLSTIDSQYSDLIVKHAGVANTFYPHNIEPVMQSHEEEEVWYDVYNYISHVFKDDLVYCYDDAIHVINQEIPDMHPELYKTCCKWAEVYFEAEISDNLEVFDDFDSSATKNIDSEKQYETLVHLATIVLPSGQININRARKEIDKSEILTSINQLGPLLMNFEERKRNAERLRKGVNINLQKENIIVKVYGVYNSNSGHLIKLELRIIENKFNVNELLEKEEPIQAELEGISENDNDLNIKSSDYSEEILKEFDLGEQSN